MVSHFTNSENSIKLHLALYDGLLVFAIFFISYTIRVVLIEGGKITTVPGRIPWLVAPAVVIHLLMFYVLGLYNIQCYSSKKILFINIFLSIFWATVVIVLVSFAFPEDKIGRLLTLSQFALMTIAFYVWRLRCSARFTQYKIQRVLFIGWNALVEKITSLLDVKNLGYEVGSVVIPPTETIPAALGNPIPVFRSFDEALSQTNPRTIVVAKDSHHIEHLRSQLLDLRFRSMEIFSGTSFYESVLGKVPVSEISESWLLYSGREGQFQPPVYLQVKRIIDFTISLLVLITTFPVFLLVSLLIKIDSKGPVFFKQERLGLDEHPFTLLKFRTMIDNAEKETGPCWACENDVRSTRLGKFLRKTRLDEFPQFINVLKGDMSLVGPRPIRKHFADIFTEKFPFYRLRFNVKPGITGWAQVNMDYVNTEADQYNKLEYEVYYLYHQSIILDLFILLKTLQSMVHMRGG